MNGSESLPGAGEADSIAGAGKTSGSGATSAPKLRKPHSSLAPRPAHRGPYRKPPRRGKITPAIVDRVAALAAGGVPTRESAAVLRLSPTTITAIKSREEVQTLIVKLRETIRELSLSEIAKGQQQAWSWLNEIIALQDSKSFDLVTRGLSALEKVASSASGEARRVEGIVLHEHTDNRVEARELLQRLLAVDTEVVVPVANTEPPRSDPR